MESPSALRVRFAPSPTGPLHIGGLRTALYNYLIARKAGRPFVLRIEDTDQKRFVPGAEDEIIEALRWAGLPYDVGAGVVGPFEQYRQSERSELYTRYAQELVDQGHAYYAFDTADELEQMRKRLMEAGVAAPKYDAETRGQMRNTFTLPAEEVLRLLDEGAPRVVRLNVPADEDVQFDDAVRGSVTFNTQTLDDQVLIKSDGLPTYHLANVVDDHLMEITLVVRGEEWLPSTPKHILLYRYLGWEPPQMAHLPLILSPTGGKLSKRASEKAGIPTLMRQYITGFDPPEQPEKAQPSEAHGRRRAHQMAGRGRAG
jgi:glutamyl-tRNA synthetase